MEIFDLFRKILSSRLDENQIKPFQAHFEISLNNNTNKILFRIYPILQDCNLCGEGESMGAAVDDLIREIKDANVK